MWPYFVYCIFSFTSSAIRICFANLFIFYGFLLFSLILSFKYVSIVSLFILFCFSSTLYLKSRVEPMKSIALSAAHKYIDKTIWSLHFDTHIKSVRFVCDTIF